METKIINIGVDSETMKGPPITFQFYSEDIELKEIIWIKSVKHCTRDFLKFLDTLPGSTYKNYILWGHNLSFDVVSFFYDRHKILRDGKCEFWLQDWKIEIIYSSVTFCIFTKNSKRFTLIDTFAYFKTSLAKLADMVCPDLPKLDMPKGLGKKKFSKSDKEFYAYAMRDSEIAYRVGKQIYEMHKEFDVPMCVSAPHFASRVFRRKYIKVPIPLPPRKIIYSAMNSYHGGKNTITVPYGFYRRVYAADIISAYPFAMQNLPSFSNPKLYKEISGSGTPNKLPPYAIYKISGEAKECKWPILFDHGFKAISGEFSNTWVTGFELNEALRMKEVILDSVFGYYYDAEKDKIPSPFKAYVDEFFKRKDNPEDKIHREFYKLLLNSLYGKFIQTVGGSNLFDLTFDLDTKELMDDSTLIAGGLFNPFIATLITGHTRAYLHRLEHQYQAIHSSTDSVFTLKKPKLSTGLGGIGIEAYGDLLLFRNKLYIFYGPDKGNESKLASGIFHGKRILKYALHGFHGDVLTLEKLHSEGIREYEYTKVNKLRESLRRNLIVNNFEKRLSTVKF